MPLRVAALLSVLGLVWRQEGRGAARSTISPSQYCRRVLDRQKVSNINNLIWEDCIDTM